MAKQTNNAGTGLGFDAQFWATADKLQDNMKLSDYRHVVLGLIFLKKYLRRIRSQTGGFARGRTGRSRESWGHLAENVFWVPKEARRSYLQVRDNPLMIGNDIDDAMLTIDAKNASLKGVQHNKDARQERNKVMPGELIDPVIGANDGNIDRNCRLGETLEATV